ncbi:MAG TPA: GxxExxY protein [Candidatus Anammoximicrobium sp.]|nr:GxxExxY protein [Candidatus Anammoximicrobium sp.]
MPIEVKGTIRVLDQQQFGEIAFEVMKAEFDVHDDLGRFLAEGAYQNELAQLLGSRADTGVWIRVRHGDFCKVYVTDLVVDQGALFELKAVESLQDEHRAQLLNYLLLMGLKHGKLINFRPERVEHEFVNTTLTREIRTRFEVDDSGWDRAVDRGHDIRSLVVELLREWGTGLDLQLYEEAVTFFLGGPERVIREIDIVSKGRKIGRQPVRLADSESVFKITSLHRDLERFESHARKFLEHTALQRILWINVNLHKVTCKTISKADLEK